VAAASIEGCCPLVARALHHLADDARRRARRRILSSSAECLPNIRPRAAMYRTRGSRYGEHKDEQAAGSRTVLLGLPGRALPSEKQRLGDPYASKLGGRPVRACLRACVPE
jgi:hypothetical protein